MLRWRTRRRRFWTEHCQLHGVRQLVRLTAWRKEQAKLPEAQPVEGMRPLRPLAHVDVSWHLWGSVVFQMSDSGYSMSGLLAVMISTAGRSRLAGQDFVC